MRAICCVAALVLGLVLAALGYRVIFAGAVTPAPDGRSAILLNAAERDLVLTEMRAFLQAVQGIVQAVSAGDPAGAAQAARAVGSAGTAEVPISLMAKLPVGFKQLGMATHGAFDQLALDAESSQTWVTPRVSLPTCCAIVSAVTPPSASTPSPEGGRGGGGRGRGEGGGGGGGGGEGGGGAEGGPPTMPSIGLPRLPRRVSRR